MKKIVVITSVIITVIMCVLMTGCVSDSGMPSNSSVVENVTSSVSTPIIVETINVPNVSIVDLNASIMLNGSIL